jgi:tetratricopeptide (TPR) repeat protein
VKAIAIYLLLAAGSTCTAQTEADQLIEQGHWKRARALVDARPMRDALTQFLLSQIHNAFGDRESPLPLAEKAVALDGSVGRYHRQVAEATGVMAQHSGLFQQLFLARRFKHEIDIAIALDPRDVQALHDLMEFYLLAPGIAGGDKDKARATAERIAHLDVVQGYLAQARLAEAAGDRLRQESALRKAVEAGPSHYRARVALADFLLAHGYWEGARKEASIAESIDGTRVDAYNVLASVFAHRGELGELDALLAVAEKEVPDDLTPHYRAAEVLESTGQDLNRSQRYFRRYLSLEAEGNAPTLADARAKAAEVSARIGAISGTRASPGPG